MKWERTRGRENEKKERKKRNPLRYTHRLAPTHLGPAEEKKGWGGWDYIYSCHTATHEARRGGEEREKQKEHGRRYGEIIRSKAALE